MTSDRQTVKNPWRHVPAEPPFVLKCDAEKINAYNSSTSSREKYLHTDLIPIPFLGRKDAPVLLLNLNPGYHPKDYRRQTKPYFIQQVKKCMLHERMAYPLFFLDPAIEGKTDGAGRRWWKRILHQLLADYPERLLAQMLFCIEYFPYRSHSFRSTHGYVESQQYGFSLVRKALKRRAMVIMMRSEKLWLEAVPELKHYRSLFLLASPRSPTLSKGNLKDGFRVLVATIEKNA